MSKRRARNRATVEKYMAAAGSERSERYLLFAEDCIAGLRTTEHGKPVFGRGREQVRGADAWNARYSPDWKFTDIKIYETQDPNFFFVDSGGEGHIEFPAYPRTFYRNHYIHTFRLDDGLITEYWEYMNPCVEMHALGIDVPTIDKPPFGP